MSEKIAPAQDSNPTMEHDFQAVGLETISLDIKYDMQGNFITVIKA